MMRSTINDALDRLRNRNLPRRHLALNFRVFRFDSRNFSGLFGFCQQIPLDLGFHLANQAGKWTSSNHSAHSKFMSYFLILSYFSNEKHHDNAFGSCRKFERILRFYQHIGLNLGFLLANHADHSQYGFQNLSELQIQLKNLACLSNVSTNSMPPFIWIQARHLIRLSLTRHPCQFAWSVSPPLALLGKT